MALRVTEYGGYASGRPLSDVIPGQAIQAQVSTAASGGAASTMTLSSGTRFITLDSDAGMYVYIGSSVSTIVASSTTASFRVPANVAPITRYVSPYWRLVSAST